jgi:DNA-binding beta-propeller fold protein YncE
MTAMKGSVERGCSQSPKLGRPVRFDRRFRESDPEPTPGICRCERQKNHLWQASRAGLVAVALALVHLPGCEENANTMGRLDLVWGRRGISDGRFQKPRAMAIDGHDRIYVVDMTARIQVFDADGHFLHKWPTPERQQGKPTGLTVGRDGRVLVADTHYYRVLIYSPKGELVATLGGTAGQRAGQFGLVTDAVEDSQGNLYVSEYGEYDRIQKFAPDGRFLLQWGGHGSEPGRFRRPQNLAVDEEDQVWVADACNHRIQVFSCEGELVKIWGTPGGAPGELYYPYDLVLAADGTLYISEFGNHRVQRFTRDGQSLGCWGSHGPEEGKLHNPWALVSDSRGRIHVLDTGNHRVQRLEM